MPSLISHLSATEKKALLDDLNYLNIAEYKSFCDATKRAAPKVPRTNAKTSSARCCR